MDYKSKYKKYKQKYKNLNGGYQSQYYDDGSGITDNSVSIEDGDSAYDSISHESIMEDFQNSHSVCGKNIAVYPEVSRIISIGDLHGDFNAMFKALRLGKVIDRKGNWIGGDTYVVQVGDILDCDRGGSKVCSDGAEEIKILDFFFKLNGEAEKDGGRVINILGNHELMNVIGDFRYASPQHTKALGGKEKRTELFRPGGEVAKKMACHMQPLVKIGKYIFVHGAILPSHLDSESPTVNNERLQTLTDLVKRYLLGELSLETFQRDFPKEFKIVNPQGEMFWNRELSKQSANGRCEKAESVLKKLGADNGAIIMGHTPHPEITQDCGGRLWKIDIGMSEGFERHHNLQVLEILDNGREVNVLK